MNATRVREQVETYSEVETEDGESHTLRTVWGGVDTVRRVLGVRFYRRIIIIRKPFLVAINLSTHPSISFGFPKRLLNLSAQSLKLHVTAANGLQYRRTLLRWRPGKILSTYRSKKEDR